MLEVQYALSGSPAAARAPNPRIADLSGFQELFETFSGYFQDIFQIFSGNFPGYFPDIFYRIIPRLSAAAVGFEKVSSTSACLIRE